MECSNEINVLLYFNYIIDFLRPFDKLVFMDYSETSEIYSPLGIKLKTKNIDKINNNDMWDRLSSLPKSQKVDSSLIQCKVLRCPWARLLTHIACFTF